MQKENISRLNGNLFQLIFRQIVEFWPYYITGVVGLFLTHYIQSNLPFMARELADLVKSSDANIEIWRFFLLALGIVVFRTSSRLLFFYPARVQQMDLRVEMLNRIENASPNRYKHKYNSGQLFQILYSDFEQIRAFTGFVLLQLSNTVFAVFVLVPKLISFSPELMWGLIPMFIAFVFFTGVAWTNRHHYRDLQDLQGEVQNFIMESFAGKKTIQNFHAESIFRELFARNSLKELMSFYRAGKNVALFRYLIPLGMGASLMWGAHIIKAEELGASSLILFSGFVFLFLEPLMFLSWIGVLFSRSTVSWKRIKELIYDLNTTSERELKLASLNEKSEDHFVIDYWDGEIEIAGKEKGWSTLIGNTGCGKSEALLKIADCLKLKGMNISLVAQSPYVYNDTIKNNIFLGADPSEEELERAHAFLKLFVLEYLASGGDELMDLEVGENGTRISGGQGKRLCLVRSIMSGADYLLWDDPFSSVDLVLEREIIDKLKEDELMKSKTVFLTSHRAVTVRKSDYSILLEKDFGIKEQGVPKELFGKMSETREYFKDQLV